MGQGDLDCLSGAGGSGAPQTEIGHCLGRPAFLALGDGRRPWLTDGWGIGKSIPEANPEGLGVVSAENCAALFSPSRRGCRRPSLVFVLVVAPSSPFRPLAS